MQSRATDDRSLEAHARETEAIERKVWRAVDVTSYPSQEEADQVKQHDPSLERRSRTPSRRPLRMLKKRKAERLICVA